MKLLLENKNGVHDITQFVPSVTWSGEYNQASRRLELDIIASATDINVATIVASMGDIVRLSYGGAELFVGFIFAREKNTDSNTVGLSCFDSGIYLLRNKYSYKFNGITPENITKKVAADFGISIGSLASTGVSISKNFLGTDLYSIIMSVYNEASQKNGVKYMVTFKSGKLNVIEKGTVALSVLLEPGSNLFSASYSESIERMVNSVAVFNSDDNLVEVIKNDEHRQLYGIMQDYYKQVEGVSYQSKAKSMLSGPQRKVSTTTIGNIECLTGKSVTVNEPFTGLNGKFYIDGDRHVWKNGIYTCKLVLNFLNMMDEKDSGREEKEE